MTRRPLVYLAPGVEHDARHYFPLGTVVEGEIERAIADCGREDGCSRRVSSTLPHGLRARYEDPSPAAPRKKPNQPGLSPRSMAGKEKRAMSVRERVAGYSDRKLAKEFGRARKQAEELLTEEPTTEELLLGTPQGAQARPRKAGRRRGRRFSALR